ncbi:hypothetical protein CJ030_MR0G026016 [Morella rubra]|uniref:Uncharacterized protein n=1 Tax=Morella rubra TaxID=262757 RepID=A0A6A1UGD0_9ROSI|nr:hypothetical protein CJ030_MR0G026016 [Morella rubra]
MNTKTMRLPPRRVLTPNVTNKRKERDGFDALKPPTPKLSKPTIPPKVGSYEPIASNQLLAGYMAHEFLTRGTLFGQPLDPARNEVVPVSKKGCPNQNGEGEPSGGTERRQLEDYQRYVEVANLLKSDGAHLPGIVNPTQLACFLQL